MLPPHHSRLTSRAVRFLAGLTLAATLVVIAGDSAHAVTFDFDNFVPIENVPAFPPKNADGSTSATMQSPS